MFRAIILPIFRSTRLCVTACGIMHPRYCRPATGRQNTCPKHVELNGIINKPLSLHLVVCLYYLYIIIYFLRLAEQSQFIPLQNVVYFITLLFLVRKIFTFYISDVLLLNVHFLGQRVNPQFSVFLHFCKIQSVYLTVFFFFSTDYII